MTERIIGCDFGVPASAGAQAKKIILIEAIRLEIASIASCQKAETNGWSATFLPQPTGRLAAGAGQSPNSLAPWSAMRR